MYEMVEVNGMVAEIGAFKDLRSTIKLLRGVCPGKRLLKLRDVQESTTWRTRWHWISKKKHVDGFNEGVRKGREKCLAFSG